MSLPIERNAVYCPSLVPVQIHYDTISPAAQASPAFSIFYSLAWRFFFINEKPLRISRWGRYCWISCRRRTIHSRSNFNSMRSNYSIHANKFLRNQFQMDHFRVIHPQPCFVQIISSLLRAISQDVLGLLYLHPVVFTYTYSQHGRIRVNNMVRNFHDHAVTGFGFHFSRVLLSMSSHQSHSRFVHTQLTLHSWIGIRSPSFPYP